MSDTPQVRIAPPATEAPSSSDQANHRGDGRLSAVQYAELFDSAPNGILCLDAGYNLLFVNQTASILLGSQALLGRNFFEAFPGNLEEPFYSSYRTTMEQRVATDFEAFYSSPLEQWYRIMVRPFSVGIVVFFHEITERKLAESLRDRAIRELEETFEITTDAILRLNCAWEITFLNRRAREILSGDGHLLGKVIWEAFPASADPASDYSIFYRRTMEERVVCAFETFYPAPLNRFFSIEARPSDDGIVLFFRDITERRESEKALVAQQHLLGIVQKAACMATWNHELTTSILTFGPGSFPVFGHSLESLNTVEAFEAIIVPEHRGRIREAVRNVLHGARTLLVDFQVAAPDGSLLWIESRGQVIEDAETPAHIGGMSIDITHRKKAEAALIQSEKLAAVGRLASSISHEINNPLEAITNLLYLIAMSAGLPQDLKVYIHMAQAELTRVSQIATQTLRFHRQAVSPTRVSPADLVDAVLNLYQGRLGNSAIKVSKRYATTTKALCFENDIRQVLNNLIANAIDAMRHGGHLLVRAHDATDRQTGGKGVRITIADTGHGMSAEVMSHVFEPFYTTKNLNGTGLGLWISSGIVERHHGRLGVRSSESPAHHGTVFTLFLPIDAHLSEPDNS